MKKLSRLQLKNINGGTCPGGCPTPPGTLYGPSTAIPRPTHSCAQYKALSDCCKSTVIVAMDCFSPVID